MRLQWKFFRQLFLAACLVLPTTSFAIDSYDPTSGIVQIPSVRVGDELFSVGMLHLGNLVFQVTLAEAVTAIAANPDTFDADSGMLNMPAVIVGEEIFEVDMMHQGDLVFSVTSARLISSNNSGDAGAIIGAWKKPCGLDDDDNDEDEPFYDIVDATFSGNIFTTSIHIYQDSACTIPFAGFPNARASGVFIVGNSVTTTSGVMATELDTHITQTNGAPFIIDGYGLFYIDGNTLYVEHDADNYSGESPELRSDTLDTNRVFYRQ